MLSLLASLLVSSAQGQTLADCSAALTAGDYDGDGLLRKVEFINFLLALSPYSPLCPDLGQVGDFLVGGFYYNVFSTASCYCLDYDDNADCCAVPALRVPGTYADPAYVERVCTDVLAVIDSSCAPPAPTVSPVAEVAVRETASPSLAPTTAPSASATVFVDLPPIVVERGSTKRLEPWVRILLPFLGLLAVGGALLLMDYSRHRQKRKRYASKGILFGSDDGSHNEYPDYPEILEATETEATETEDATDRSAEEGTLFAAPKKAKKKKKVSSKKKKSKRSKEVAGKRTPDKLKKKVSWNVELPPPDSPNRMSRFLETLDLEDTTARPYAPTKPASPKALSTPQLGTTSKDSASDASSVDIFMDEHDDMSASSSGDNITNNIKRRLLHPTTLSNGAVEVFPLPPIRNVNSLSSSSSSSHDPYKNESKESDSDSEMYVLADPEDGNVISESSDTTEWTEFQPRHPEGGRLEPDGVRLSEHWLEDNRVDGTFLV